jgi:branched-chain amino acid transport system ATP-binding protein
MTPMLELNDVHVAYGEIMALHGVSLKVEQGEIVALLGANGAGKSTTLRAISGMLPVSSGSIKLNGQDITKEPAHKIVELGIAHVPEGRGIFSSLTVLENLELSTWTRKDKLQINKDYDMVFQIFPRLAERRKQLGGTLSGGEQQMLAVGRALMTRSPLMLLDEPSMGLSPLFAKEIFRIVREINAGGTTILLVEQNANMALKVANRGYVLETGVVALTGPAGELAGNDKVREAYLGR